MQYYKHYLTVIVVGRAALYLQCDGLCSVYEFWWRQVRDPQTVERHDMYSIWCVVSV